MNEIQKGNAELPKVKIWNGKRVVTFRDIDEVHQRTNGTASRNFKTNKKHFIKGVDYFLITREDFNGRNSSIEENIGNVPPKGLTLVTESGYLMITKSFTDDLSWDVQRQLVNSYFQVQQETPEPQPALPEPTPFDSWSITKKPEKGKWFNENNWKLKIILDRFGWTRKFLYHKILSELSDLYNLSVEEKAYTLAHGHAPEYKLDLLDHNKRMRKTATDYINYLLTEEGENYHG